MARNKITDLNDHLFAQLERLGDEDMTAERLDIEQRRTKAISEISRQVTNVASLVFKTAIAVSEGNIDINKLPDFLSDGVQSQTKIDKK
jgi:hypothetical protein